MRSSLLILVLAGVAPAPAAAAGRPWDDLVAAALRDNPEVRAARERWNAAAQAPRAAGALPDAELSAGYALDPVETRGGPIDGRVALRQGVPFLGKRGLRARAARGAAEAARQAYRAKRLAVEADVVAAYGEAFFLRRKEEILSEQAGLLAHFARVAENKYSVGKGPQAMAFRAQVELAKVRNDILTARRDAVRVRARLNALLDRPSDAGLAVPVDPGISELSPSSAAWTAAALARRPELAALRALEEKSREERRLALREYFPDLMLGFERTFIGGGSTNAAFDGRDANMLSAALSLPLPFGRRGAQARAASAARDAASASLDGLRATTRYQVTEHYTHADTAARLVALYEGTLLPQARSALKATQSGYEADALGFLDLLDSERMLLRFELELERYKADFTMHAAQLKRIAGGDPAAEEKDDE